MKDPAAPKAQLGREPRPARSGEARSPRPGRMTVAGRVLDPDGKPVQGAVVDLVARPRAPWVGASEETDRLTLLGQGQSDGDGRFRLDAARTASTRVFEVYALAAAPGYGLGWAELNPDAEQPAAEIRLQPEQVIRVRLVDVTGTPAAGVEVRVAEHRPAERQGHVRRRLALDATRPRASAPGRGRSRPTTRGGSPLPGIGRGVERQPRRPRPPLRPAGPVHRRRRARRPARRSPSRSSRPGSSRAVSWPPTPASRSPNAVVSATTLVQNEHASGYLHRQVPRRRRGPVHR